MSSPEHGSDPWLDAKLRNVPLPIGLLARLGALSETAARYSTDERIDAALGDVPLPPGMLERLRGISSTPQPRFTWRQLAMAASVVVALGVGYLTVQSGLIGQVYELAKGRQSPTEVPVASTEQMPLESEPLIATTPKLPGGDESLDPAPGALEPAVLTPRFAESPSVPDDIRPLVLPPALVPREVQAELAFGTVGGVEVAPELEMVTRPLSHGLTPPRVQGYDLLFQLKYGDHPFLSPSAHKDLQTSRVPLVIDSASYQLAWRYLKQKQLPPPEDVRTEEFLAAMDYGFSSPAAGSLGLRTAAGPAPFGEPGLRLLQIGVQAGPLAPSKRLPAHLTVAVDVSSGMRWSGRLEMVRGAVGELVEQLGPQDSLSVIACGDRAEMVVENATRESLSRVQSGLFSLQSRPVTNLASGLELACSAARPSTDGAGASYRLVVLTDGSHELTDEAAARVMAAISSVAAAGVTSQVIDLGREKELPPLVTQLASATRRPPARAATADEIRWTMLETLSGQSSVVARRAALKVTFKPDVVAGYRLVGHESVTLTGPSAAPLEIDFRAGQAATALYELWLKPGLGEEVAVAELTWQDPVTQKPQRAVQRISRLQFAKSLAESPMSLQAAALAAHTAETLRGSYYATAPRALGRVLEAADEVHARLAQQAEFREFIAFVELAEKLGPRVSPARKDAVGGSR